ncbi:L-cystine transport system permease protein TcyL [Paenibacillus baekrokdamisoli]|uniref:L-cystine transport system permease protein TcyL n=1 Tax=Paenibacillus baekrokdamisoli TaxID=1712516 RepID=A0A3G9JEF1_9BACL|nr:amino acid ABC transporter permease [Paenibacillus baekrokdamisoli]MBB3071155.1 L-cystine transport system permease protein [Paenibacillus baekrokdamisoli]BBH21574.1 L-cystine transport system permease protein TcyL [Paenibacillus baekrokdamisoli]
MGASFDITYVFDYFIKILPTLKITLLIVASSILLGLGVGFIVALPRLYNIPVLKRFSQVYVSFFRGTPILIQLFLFYYGLPEILKLIHIDVSKVPSLYFVILTYTLHSGAFMSETIRGAVAAVDRGQVEAAYAVGMTGRQAFARIILPQALAISIPVFANLVIANLKDTSLAFSLGIMEMTGKAQSLGSLDQHFVESYLALALAYYMISFILEKLFIRLERRLLRHEQRVTASSKWNIRLWKKRSYQKLGGDLEISKGGAGL